MSFWNVFEGILHFIVKHRRLKEGDIQFCSFLEDEKLRIMDPATGEFFPEYNDVMEERDSALNEREAALIERDAAARERDMEIARRLEVEAELERLREEMRRGQD